jgi:hypothetical protein
MDAKWAVNGLSLRYVWRGLVPGPLSGGGGNVAVQVDLTP